MTDPRERPQTAAEAIDEIEGEDDGSGGPPAPWAVCATTALLLFVMGASDFAGVIEMPRLVPPTALVVSGVLAVAAATMARLP